MVQWLGLGASIAGGTGSIPDRELRPCMPCALARKKKFVCVLKCVPMCKNLRKNFGLERKVDLFSWPQWAFFACITDITRDHPWFESQKETHTRKGLHHALGFRPDSRAPGQ